MVSDVYCRSLLCDDLCVKESVETILFVKLKLLHLISITAKILSMSAVLANKEPFIVTKLENFSQMNNTRWDIVFKKYHYMVWLNKERCPSEHLHI